MTHLFTPAARFARRFRKTLLAVGICAGAVAVLNWATSASPRFTLEQVRARSLQDTCSPQETARPKDWDMSKDRYYVRQRPAGEGLVTVTLWGWYTSGYRLAGVVKKVEGPRLLVRPVFERAHYGDGVQPACVFVFGLELDFTGLSEGAYSVGIAPTPLERLLD